MNKVLVELTEKLAINHLGSVRLTFTILLTSLLIIFFTIQFGSIFTYLAAEAQIPNNNASESNNRTAALLSNTTLDIGSNNTIQDLTLPELFEKAETSVVQVTTTSDTDVPDTFRSGIGSGFVFNNDGLIITNYHVIAPSIRSAEELAQEERNNVVDINVAFEDGTIYPATLVGADRFSDIAVIDIPDDARNKLVPLPIGNSSELRVGQQVVAIGNPFGLSGSMTEGIVSGLGRLIPSSEEEQLPPLPDGIPIPPPGEPSIPGLPPQDQLPPSLPPTVPDDLTQTPRRGSFSIPDIIQTDAPINPGNSGGPLLDLRGEVIGMNTAIFSSTGESAGVGFAIPSNTLQKVIPSLISTGVYQHPWLGISGTDVTPEIAESLGFNESRGFLVTDITSGSPADKAGIRGGYKIDNINGREIALGGDIIVRIDNRTVTTLENILTYISNEKQAGDIVQLSILRDGMSSQANVTLGEIPQSDLQGRPGEGQQPQLDIIP
ncbi:MAG: S1C family serine protease [Nitrososphaeraceae archaeon]